MRSAWPISSDSSHRGAVQATEACHNGGQSSRFGRPPLLRHLRTLAERPSGLTHRRTPLGRTTRCILPQSWRPAGRTPPRHASAKQLQQAIEPLLVETPAKRYPTDSTGESSDRLTHTFRDRTEETRQLHIGHVSIESHEAEFQRRGVLNEALPHNEPFDAWCQLGPTNPQDGQSGHQHIRG